MDNLQFIVICAVALFALFGSASLLSSAHADDRAKCIEAGYEWSATKYVCVVKLKK